MENITMEQLGLSAEVLKAVGELGFTTPTPVQSETIPLLLNKQTDLVALAQTGTGKTAAYGLPIIERITLNNKSTQALILCPTRELCIQITKDLKNYSKYISGLKIEALYGGSDIARQIKSLAKGVQIIVATPGRMLDLMQRGHADISSITTVVLDEADEMLNMGFQEDLDAILAQTPDDKNVHLFSATMPREAEKISEDYMNNPVRITIGKRNAGAENVQHVYYMVQARYRYEALKRVADINPDIYGIIFCRTRAETKEFANKLIQDGYNADALHGDLSQAQRESVMHKFRIKNLQMLVATDVAARGLDVSDLTHIINVDLPEDLEIYTHRSGRTGRAGKTGVSISIIHSREKGKLQRIEKIIGQKFEYRPVPAGKEICVRQLFHLIDKMENVQVDHQQIDPYLPEVYKKLESLSKENLIKNFVALEFNRFLEYYRNAPDINYTEKHSPEFERDKPRRRREQRRDSGDFVRFFIDVGSKDKVDTRALIGFINRQCKNRDMRIGNVEVLKTFSFFEIDEYYASGIIDNFKRASFDGKKIKVELAQSKGSSGRSRRKSFSKPAGREEGFRNRNNKPRSAVRKKRRHS